MTNFRVGLNKNADKQLYSIPEPHHARIIQAMEKLAVTPKPVGSTKLAGFENCYRLRIGKYRVAYMIDEKARTVCTVWVVAIGVRDSIYEEVKRRYWYL